MCKFKSGIILKDRIYIPDINSHTEMLEKLGIEDSKENAERFFVRAELVPPNKDYFAQIDSWKYIVDQDILPDWYIAEVDELRMRNAVKEWAKYHIHVRKKELILTEGIHYVLDSEVTARDSSRIFIEFLSSFTFENCTLLNNAIAIDWRQNQVICRNDAKWKLIKKEGLENVCMQ